MFTSIIPTETHDECPACKDATLTITERQGIEIDYCPECRGVWLDRGERHRDDDYRYKPRKSFLRELFD